MLAELEKECDNKGNYDLNLVKAMEVCKTIINNRKKNEMEERIRLKITKTSLKSNT